MISAASKTLEGQAIALISSAGIPIQRLFGLAGECWGTSAADDIRKEPLTQHTACDLLHLLDFVFSGLSGGKDDDQLRTLVRSVQIVDHAVLRVEAAKWAEEARVQALNELVANTNGVVCLCGERAGGVQHPLIIFDRR